MIISNALNVYTAANSSWAMIIKFSVSQSPGIIMEPHALLFPYYASTIVNASHPLQRDGMMHHPWVYILYGSCLCCPFSRSSLMNTTFLVYFQMAKNPDVVCSRDPPRTAPRFCRFAGDETDTYFLFVESMVLCTTTSFTKALILWFITHYVFNLQYCKQVKEVALFFQESVFGLSEKKGKSSTYLTITSDINKYLP